MTGRYQVSREIDPRVNDAVYVLRDHHSGAVARVAPSLGHNMYSLEVLIGGSRLEAMIDPGSPAYPGVRMGNPILFPFPNRIRAGRFAYRGREVQLDAGFGGNAIHGLVNRLPWKVEATSDDQAGAVTASIDSADHPDIGRQFPFPFRFAVTYALAGSTVEIAAVATNPGSDWLPFGYGIHPYFRLPLAVAGRREDCIVLAPAARQWVLDAGLLPTGELADVAGDRDFRTPHPLGGTTLDDVYTSLSVAADRSTTVYRDPAAGAELFVDADSSFRELVLYAPPGRPVLCIEPYTCTTDAFNLQARGVDAGMLELAPGGEWRGRIWIGLRPS